MMVELRDGSQVEDVRLDRLIEFDSRSLDYPVRTLTTGREPRSYTWNFNKYPGWLDQGREGACCGFGWAHELMARPAEIPMTNQLARSIYHTAQERFDSWPGGAYPGATPFYEGTSVLAAAKAVQLIMTPKGKSVLPEYRWAFGGDDALLALGLGPIVIGVVWTEGMARADAKGFIHPTGQVMGGHCVMLRGVKVVWKANATHSTTTNVDRERTILRGRNSWGMGWGVNGDFFLTLAALDNLLARDGEVCVPVTRNY